MEKFLRKCIQIPVVVLRKYCTKANMNKKRFETAWDTNEKCSFMMKTNFQQLLESSFYTVPYSTL